jgi:hypothetical protein
MVMNNKMRCLIVTLTHFIRYIGFILPPSRDSVTFVGFVCWCRLCATLFGSGHRLRAISLHSHDLFGVVAFV